MTRIRRVKCDETKPYCRKCTATGRQCEGPVVRQFRIIQDQPVSRSTTPKPQLEVSLLAPQHSEDGRRAFHYFTHCAAPLFAGVVDASFWEDLVPRLAQTYDFVWETVACLSSLFEHVPYTSLTTTYDSAGLPKVLNREHREALRFYNKAISNVRQLVERHQIDDSIIALSCILFASVEFQQKHVKTGADLVKRCSNILTDNLTTLRTRQNSSASQAVHQVLAPFVLRKAILIATLGNTLPPQSDGGNMLTAVLSRFPTLNEARVELHRLANRSYELIRVADFVSHVKAEDPGKNLFVSQRQSLLDKLMKWKASFTAAIRGMPQAETNWIRSYLLMYWSVCYTSLATCISPSQTVFDNYMDQFAEIVEHATVYLNHSARFPKVQLVSSFDPGVIPALYFCATKCRDSKLRRKALRLLRQAPRQEELWAFVAPERVVAKVISMEEDEAQISSPETYPGSHCAGLPPEKRRYAHVSVLSRQAPGGIQRQALEMSRFEFRPDGSRRLINDYTWLDDGKEVWADTQREDLDIVTRNTNQGEHGNKDGFARMPLPLIAGRLTA